MDVNSIGNIYVIPEHDPKSGRVLRDGGSMTVPGVMVSDIPDERQRSICMSFVDDESRIPSDSNDRDRRRSYLRFARDRQSSRTVDSQ